MPETERPDPATTAYTGSTNGGVTGNSSVRDALNTGRQGVAAAASEAKTTATGDLENLRKDLTSLKDTVTKFMSQASGEAANSVREASGSLAQQVGEAGSKLATTVTDQAKTFASELEEFGKRNPLGSMGAAVVVGLLIGLWGRARH
jgi:ElaB/YqjD/DUF883 family membrane-anchored ribosome-binding protein